MAPNERAIPDVLEGPFGPAALVERVSTERLVRMYRDKCGLDVGASFGQQRELGLYQCQATGMLFWWPRQVAGDEAFYRSLSDAWPSYYQPWRWEYDGARRRVPPGADVLEVGCGRGYFLRALEPRARQCIGLEFNAQAIRDKVTQCEVLATPVETLAAAHPGRYDVVCSFQVLEHVMDPASFLQACTTCLRPGGTLLVSVPNYEHVNFANRLDAFDLPPHHVNHFTPDSMALIATHLHLRIESVQLQPRIANLETVHRSTAQSLGYRIAARAARMALNVAYAAAREPGHTMLCVLRKPGTGH